MEFNVKSGHPEKQRTACIIAAVFESRRLSSAAERLDNASNCYISNILRKGDLEGKLGQILLLHNVPNILSDRILLIGCGKERELADKQYQDIITTIVNTLNETGSMEAICFIPECHVKGRDIHWKIQQAIIKSNEALYNFDTYKSKKDLHRRPLRKMIFSIPTRRDLTNAEVALNEGIAISKAVKYAKDLANTPANICNPSYLAKEAIKLAKEYKNISAAVLDKKDLRSLGMGAMLAVAEGSSQPPKLITLEYRGNNSNKSPIVLVGKGITFDSGGNSLKPASAMIGMKYDMCGAAAVLGIILFAAEINLPINLVGVIAAAENMPGGTACRPDDIVKSLSGKTIEIANTDAEGRLVLCDALTYSERFKPEVVIDIATLTGACIIALGHEYAGLFSNHNPLAHELLTAGNMINDKCWQMPLAEEYQNKLNSKVADLVNVGGKDGASITAACFLSRFTKKYHWAHLDIAGTSRYRQEEGMATGKPVPLLAQYLLNYCKG